jgi:hypothetical protein
MSNRTIQILILSFCNNERSHYSILSLEIISTKKVEKSKQGKLILQFPK